MASKIWFIYNPSLYHFLFISNRQSQYIFFSYGLELLSMCVGGEIMICSNSTPTTLYNPTYLLPLLFFMNYQTLFNNPQKACDKGTVRV